MVDGAGLAVHQPGGGDDPAAEMLPDRLVAEADSEQRAPRLGACRHELERNAGIVGRSGPRRDQEALGRARHRFAGRELIVPPHEDLGAELAQIMDDVPGEAVVVVEDEDHAIGISRRDAV